MSTSVELLDSIRAHLAEFELPALWSVDVTASVAGPSVSMQLDCHQPPEVAGGLLAWADTLSEVTAEAWRVPSGDSVHLLVFGQLSDGVTVRVYGGVPFTGLNVGADLAPDSRTTVPLTVLRAMTTLGEAIR
ncbi:MAG: hypothetical protein ACRDSH_24235 [Pseudonocardiaceae bacterium]